MGKHTCSVGGCERSHYGRGWCSMHYKRWWKHGDPLAHSDRRTYSSFAERFWVKVDHSGGSGACWPWMASLDRRGYGQFGVGGSKEMKVRAHRVAWELTCGPIPDGLWTLHHCDNRSCCNPAHLFLGTHQDNMDDMWRKGRARPRGKGAR